MASVSANLSRRIQYWSSMLPMTSICLILIGCLAVPAEAAPAVKEILTPAPPNVLAAIQAAKANTESVEGGRYDATCDPDHVMVKTMFSKIMKHSRSPKPEPPFVILIKVASSGEPEEVMVWPETPMAKRARKIAAAARYLAPPGPAWWVEIDVNIIDDTGNESAESMKPPSITAPVGIVYGITTAAAVKAPDGWVVDNKSGLFQGVHCVMYPKDVLWTTTSRGIYVLISSMDSTNDLAETIKIDTKRFRKYFKGVKDEEMEPITSRNGQELPVRLFWGGKYTCFDYVAYVHYGNDVVLMVLVCASRSELDEMIPEFRKMAAGAIVGPKGLILEKANKLK